LITNTVDLSPDTILFDKFRVVKLLGCGGMGSVFQVEHLHLRTQYALKCLNKLQHDDATWRRFEIEARAANILDHPNLIKVHDSGLLPDGQPYFVMDFVNGVTLADEISRTGRLPVPSVLKLFIQVGFALAYAHERGVIHRDIKPTNIMLVKNVDGTLSNSVKVVDFGIAKLTGQDEFNQQTLTRTGEIFGSPLYMSPEQCMGIAVDHRSDLYSLGCVMYETLTGAPPLVGENALSTMMKHQTSKPLPLKEASMGIEFSEQLESLVQKLLQKDPENRYSNASLLTADLVALEQNLHSGITVSLNLEKPSQAENRLTRFFVNRRVSTIILVALFLAFVSGFGTGWLMAKRTDHNQIEKVMDLQDNYDLLPGLNINGKVVELTSKEGRKDAVSLPDSISLLPPDLQKEELEAKRAEAARLAKVKIGHINFGATYFSDDAKQQRTFHFPSSSSLGLIEPNMMGVSNPTEMQGLKSLAVPVSITANDALILNSHLFSKFRQDEPAALSFMQSVSPVKSLLFEASKFNKIHRLDLEKSAVTSADLSAVERFKGLTHLSFSRTSISATDLMHLKGINKLYFLGLCGLPNISPLLKKLAKESSVQRLEVGDCNLTVDDLKTIASFKFIDYIDLTGNKIVTDDTIGIFSKAKMRHLDLEGCAVTAASIPVFKKMKNLKSLRISDPIVSEQFDAQETFRKELPNVEVFWVFSASGIYRKLR